MNKIFKAIQFEIKQLNDDEGFIEAYVSTYNTVDLVGDTFQTGAFDAFVSDFEGQLPMLVNHDASELPVGEWTGFRSDDYGLIGTGNFLRTYRGQEAREVVRKGLYDSVSIGFSSNDFAVMPSGGLMFRQASLNEVSLVRTPANPLAEITEVKRADGTVDLKLLKELLRKAGLSNNQTKHLLAKGQSALRNVEDNSFDGEAFLSELKSKLR